MIALRRRFFVRQLELFSALGITFCVIYGVTSGSGVGADPLHFPSMFGSYAQFLLPFGCAAGIYLAVSARSLGLQPLEERGVRPTGWRHAGRLLHLAAAISIALTGVMVLLCLLIIANGSKPNLDIGHALYPYAALVLGLGVGYALGALIAIVGRPRTAAACGVLSVTLGFVVFLVGILAHDLFSLPERYSLAMGAVVLDPAEQIANGVLFGQIAWAFFSGSALVSAVLMLQERRLRQGVITAAGFVSLLLASAFSGLQVAAPSEFLVARSSHDYQCLGKVVRICALNVELRGARLLDTALSSAYRSVPPAYRPTDVMQEGTAAKPHGERVVPVLEMPLNARGAENYAAELVVRAAGCDGNAAYESNDIVRLMAWLRQSADPGSAAVAPPWVLQVLSQLKTICKA